MENQKEEKWALEERPIQLSDVFGCQNIKDYVQAKINGDKPFDKAILLHGSTGVGKTTIAYILAGYILNGWTKEGLVNWNTDNGRDILSNTFSLNCKKIANSSKQDLIDEITQFSQYNSFFGKNKVIIVEESQQLSDAAIKSLLTILEDKSKPNIYFILLSMGEKVAKSVEDRCTVFKFQTPKVTEIMQYMKNFLEKKGLWESLPKEFQFEGLYMIAQYANGSFRSAISSLELAITTKSFNIARLAENLEIADVKTSMQFLQALINFKNEPKFIEYIFGYLKISKDFLGIFNYMKKIFISSETYCIFGKDFSENPYFEQTSRGISSAPYYQTFLWFFRQLDDKTKGFPSDFQFTMMIYDFLKYITGQVKQQ